MTTDEQSPDTSRADPAGRTEHAGRLPAQKAMKQFAKTDAERVAGDEPVGPNDGPALTQRDPQAKPRSAS